MCIRGQATLAHARGRPPHCIRGQATLAHARGRPPHFGWSSQAQADPEIGDFRSQMSSIVKHIYGKGLIHTSSLCSAPALVVGQSFDRAEIYDLLMRHCALMRLFFVFHFCFGPPRGGGRFSFPLFCCPPRGGSSVFYVSPFFWPSHGRGPFLYFSTFFWHSQGRGPFFIFQISLGPPRGGVPFFHLFSICVCPPMEGDRFFHFPILFSPPSGGCVFPFSTFVVHPRVGDRFVSFLAFFWPSEGRGPIAGSANWRHGFFLYLLVCRERVTVAP